MPEFGSPFSGLAKDRNLTDSEPDRKKFRQSVSFFQIFYELRQFFPVRLHSFQSKSVTWALTRSYEHTHLCSSQPHKFFFAKKRPFSTRTPLSDRYTRPFARKKHIVR